MYLNSKFLDWPYEEHEASGVDFKKLERAHNIWRHAQKRLDGTPSEFDIVDCVTSLKRAINSRIKTLSNEYSFDLLPNIRSKKQTLEKYQDYGLIRPSFFKELFELRNLLEHEDVQPPEVKKCRYYVDIVWYFLKSTDSLLQMKTDVVAYLEPAEDSEIYLHFYPNTNWLIRVYGSMLPKYLSDQQKTQDWLTLENVNVSADPDNPKLKRFHGDLKLTENQLIRFTRDYFGSKGYWFEDHA